MREMTGVRSRTGGPAGRLRRGSGAGDGSGEGVTCSASAVTRVGGFLTVKGHGRPVRMRAMAGQVLCSTDQEEEAAVGAGV
ncbi:hypothetical protein [Microtetraspora fusca]|uniref:hypothetical protein n=1 Tax=Microtetraspora fusca TaxID=1997 RepID=UPI00082B0F85|nr:hypothetical protein [Microtetraspora fusca]